MSSGLTLGLDAGFTIDKLLGYHQLFGFSSRDNNSIRNLQIDMSTYNTFPTKAFEFDNISWRLGLNLKKDLGKHGHLNFYLHSDIPYIATYLMNIKIQKEVILDNVPMPVISYEKNLNLKPKGLRFGVYYTFGTLTFK
jgi:hypothetical protein